MTPLNPLSDAAETEADDLQLVHRIQNGDRGALETLVVRHQDWIYNIVLRMVYHPQDAEDATQEVLLKLLTKLSTFEGRSSFRTWLYRIVVNHVLNMKRARGEEREWTFAKYASGLEGAADADLPDPRSVPADVQLLVDEARIGCSSGLLLCLDREQRLVYILGEILGVSDAVGAELLQVTRDNFRQKLSRARRDLHSFMQDKCGLVNKANPCRCAKKTQAFMQAGYVNPENLLFARTHVTRVRDVAPRVHEHINAIDEAYAEIHRDHPFHRSPDLVAALRTLLSQPRFRSLVGAVLLAIVTAACQQPVDTFNPDEIIRMERAALDRWGNGDPHGYLEIMADEITYFDPTQKKRVDGLPALKNLIVPYTGKIKIDRYEMIDPKVQRHGDIALLTFNIVNYKKQPDGTEQPIIRWNSTETYARIDGRWRIIHSHWSYVTPELKKPFSETS